MKSREQKQKELESGEGLLNKSQALIFVDFSRIKTEKINKLRSQLKNIGSQLLIMKKRLLNLLLKKKGINLDFDENKFKTSMATVFVPDSLEAAASQVYKFLKELEIEKLIEGEKLLSGYDFKNNNVLSGERLQFIGALPSREVLLAQLLGMIAAPIKSLLYLLDQKTKRSS